MSQNKLRQHFAAGGDAIGGWCTTPSAFNAEMLAVAGFDYVCVDCQHGLIGYDAMVPMLASISRTGATPVVRVPFNHTPWMGQALDAGAEIIIRSEEHTSELQSLMRISYAVFCLKKNT